MFVRDIKPIYINSAVRSTGTNEDFTITDTGDTITNSPKTVKLINACIPYTWNNIQSGSNDLTFEDSVPTQYTVQVPAGNYTGTTLAAAVETAMNGAGSGDTFTVDFDTNTYKMTFTTTGADLLLDFSTSPDLAVILGFVSGSTYGPAASITSPNVVNIIEFLEMMICSDLVCGSDNGVIPWTPNPPVSDLCILARVPIRSCYGGIVDYVASPDSPYMPITQSEFSKAKEINGNNPGTIRFYLRWPDNSAVSLNGASWTAEILFDFNE
jgi:hypothetical protein